MSGGRALLAALGDGYRHSWRLVLVNCAAQTNVDRCETHFDEAMQINAHAPRTLAEIAAAGKSQRVLRGRVLRQTLLAPDIVEAILQCFGKRSDLHWSPPLELAVQSRSSIDRASGPF